MLYRAINKIINGAIFNQIFCHMHLTSYAAKITIKLDYYSKKHIISSEDGYTVYTMTYFRNLFPSVMAVNQHKIPT